MRVQSQAKKSAAGFELTGMKIFLPVTRDDRRLRQGPEFGCTAPCCSLGAPFCGRYQCCVHHAIGALHARNQGTYSADAKQSLPVLPTLRPDSAPGRARLVSALVYRRLRPRLSSAVLETVMAVEGLRDRCIADDGPRYVRVQQFTHR